MLVSILSVVLSADPTSFTVDAQKSVLRYAITHKLHRVDGEAHSLEGRAVLGADGSLKVMVRAPVSAFKSGDGNRDEHMLETVEGDKFPFVTLKGKGQVQTPTSFPSTVIVPLEAELDFHGQKQAEPIRVELVFSSAEQAVVKAAFTVSLERYKIERPSLLFVKIEDACRISLELVAGKTP